MVGIFLTILGHVSYGTTNVLWKNPQERLGTLPLIMLRSFLCMIIFGAAHFILRSANAIPAPVFSSLDLLKTFGICAINYFGLFFYLKAMKHTKVSNTLGFGKIGLVIGVAVGYFIYDEELSVLTVFLCLAVLIAVSLIEIAGRNNSVVLSKGLLYTILCKVFWATSYLYVPFIQMMGPLLFCAILELTVCLMSGFLLLWKPAKVEIKLMTRQTKYEIAPLVLLGALGTFCLNFALANISIILFAIIGLIEPLIGLAISKLYHKESLNRLQQTGIAVGIVAAFILTLTR